MPDACTVVKQKTSSHYIPREIRIRNPADPATCV